MKKWNFCDKNLKSQVPAPKQLNNIYEFATERCKYQLLHTQSVPLLFSFELTNDNCCSSYTKTNIAN